MRAAAAAAAAFRPEPGRGRRLRRRALQKASLCVKQGIVEVADQQHSVESHHSLRFPGVTARLTGAGYETVAGLSPEEVSSPLSKALFVAEGEVLTRVRDSRR